MGHTRLDNLYRFAELLLRSVGQQIAPFMPPKSASDLLVRFMSEAVRESGLTNEAGALITGKSRAQFSRDAAMDDPDDYTVLQGIMDYLMPLHPAPQIPKDIFIHLVDYFEKLTLRRLSEVLRYYADKGYLEEVDGRYRASASFVVTDAANAERDRRACLYAPDIVRAVGGYIREQPDDDLHVLRFLGTPQEFDALMSYLKKALQDYLSSGSTVSNQDESGVPELYIVALVTTKGGKHGQ